MVKEVLGVRSVQRRHLDSSWKITITMGESKMRYTIIFRRPSAALYKVQLYLGHQQRGGVSTFHEMIWMVSIFLALSLLHVGNFLNMQILNVIEAQSFL